MKLVIFGLSISSSWGNGHATLWRGLCAALALRGHRIHFFEKDVPYYAEHRDLAEIPGCHLHLYSTWDQVAAFATALLNESDVAILTSYCPDAQPATRALFDSRVNMRVFYDLDTPITLRRLAAGETVDYLPACGLQPFDLVLSYAGGDATKCLLALGAKRVAPLYGSVDPHAYHPQQARPEFRADLSYLGTYAEERQAALTKLFIEPARRLPDRRFVIGGAQYPASFPWCENIFFVRHLAPADHPAFYCSSRLTLNVTRAAMAEWGYCPSGRLFEAAACGAPIISDVWPGLSDFFNLGTEILPVENDDQVIAALGLSDRELNLIGEAARQRTLQEHAATVRAGELEALLSNPQDAAAARELPEADGIPAGCVPISPHYENH
ncbi:MAG TPA: glycosyltransferase [Bryobacteraceae bacterium]|nr:glycosyltransferase [Bryobacteraceae bacterium]